MPDPDPPEPFPRENSEPSELHGLDPGELLARGLDTVKPSTGARGWLPPDPKDLARLLPQYQIESLLGSGGMGAVYKGTQPALERPVAIKILPAEMAADTQFISRFQREARTLAKLQHSGIVAIYDFGQTSEGHLYFVMEYVNGTDLRRILRGPGLRPDQALKVIAQICDALQAAHRQGVIHRDIKPENILLTNDGYVKLADFGLARPLGDEDASRLTASMAIMGTFDYMAPEQREGRADNRSDIFALGVMLYEMLTGKPPRGAFDPASHKIKLDVRIDKVVLKALQTEPERRYQHASEMKTDVDHIRSTPPPAQPKARVPSPRNPSIPRATVAAPKQHISFVSMAFLVALLFGAGFSIWWTQVRSKAAKNAAAASDGNVAATTDSIVGNWKFYNGDVRTFMPNGTCTGGNIGFGVSNGGNLIAHWTRDNPKETPAKYTIRYVIQGFVDQVTLQSDQKSLSGRNNHNEQVTASKIPEVSSSTAAAIQPGSVWSGDGKSLTIVERRGDTFRGHFVIGSTHVRDVAGSVTGNQISWLARDVHVVRGDAGGDNSGTIIGDRIEFTWHDARNHGAFTLMRQPPHQYVSVSKTPVSIKATPAASPVASAPIIASEKAARGQSFVNTLGQRFVPLPAHPELLFCIWETRVKDFTAFVSETGYEPQSPVDSPAMPLNGSSQSLSWKNPGFPQTGDHPVVCVGPRDANAFCRWLTKKARDIGQLSPGQEYRLPTDREWSAAMGVETEAGEFPMDRKFPEGVFGWGDHTPPPMYAENFPKVEQSSPGRNGYSEPRIWTAPVGAGKANLLGLFDLAGNVREICKDGSSINGDRSVRGASFLSASGVSGGDRSWVGRYGSVSVDLGFRCIVDLKSPARLELARRVETAVEDYISHAPFDLIGCRNRTDFLVNDEMVAVELGGVHDWPDEKEMTRFQSLPIDRFQLDEGKLRDFSTLKGMPLKSLALHTPVFSFAGLEGVPLEWFSARAWDDSPVTSLEPFRGKKLKSFSLDGFPKVMDLSPLTGQPLASVGLFNCGVTDLSPIKDAPLHSLRFNKKTRVQTVNLQWWPALDDFSGMDDIFEADLVKPALDAICAGDENAAGKIIQALGSKFGNPPWLSHQFLYRDIKSGSYSKFAHWVKGDRSELANELKVYGGHAYLHVGTPMHWSTAKEFAERLGGHLATANNKYEDDFITGQVMPKSGTAWMGLTSPPGVYGWKWITGEPFAYSNWDPANHNGMANRGDERNRVVWRGNGVGRRWYNYTELYDTSSVVVEWETPNPQDAPAARSPSSIPVTASRPTTPPPAPQSETAKNQSTARLTPAPRTATPLPGSTASNKPAPVQVSAPPPVKLIELREHAMSLTESVLGPLDRDAGASFRGYVADLREDILDEAAKKPGATANAYNFAVQLCNTLIAVEREREVMVARLDNNKPSNAAGGAGVTKVHPNWIDLERERDEAARATHNNTLETSFHRQLTVQWGLRAAELRKIFDAEIAQFRTGLRQSPPPK